MEPTIMSEQEIAQTEPEILRKHVFYQKSYTGPTSPIPTRSTSPVIKGRVKPRAQSQTFKSVTSPRKKQRAKSIDYKQIPTSFKTSYEKLDYRHKTRVDRSRPWNEKAPVAPKFKYGYHDRSRPLTEKASEELKFKYGARIFYDKTLPTNVDQSQVSMSARKYVSNSKYGNIYRIQQSKPKKKEKSPPPQKWLWEDEYLIWLNGTREKYLENTTKRVKPVTLSERSVTSLSSSLPTVGGKNYSGHRPKADVYAQYHYHRLESSKRKEAAMVLQRVFKGWYVRTFLKKLKKKALLQHGRLWPNFVQDYREVVTRIQTRYGVMKPSCPVDLREIKLYMDRKLVYEKMFLLLAKAGKLAKANLMEFFNRCDLWPTQGDINRAFDTIFRGSMNTAEVVFVLDCSSSAGVVGFHNIIKFVKDIVVNLDVAPDRIRIGVVPFNEDAINCFGISTYDNKQEILDAIGKIKIQHGLTRTDLALRLMKELFKNSRPGVQRVAIVIADSQSENPGNTRKEARTAKDSGIEIISISVGNDPLEDMLAIASSADHVYRAMNAKSLTGIKRQIEKRFCIASCGFCQRLIPRITDYGLARNEAMDIGWTIFPPLGAGIRPSNYLHKFNLDTEQPNQSKPSDTSHVTRPLEKSEALEILFTCYPLPACGLGQLHFSRWIRPVIDGKEAWSLMDEDIIKATGMKACLRLVIQARLSRHGYITVPSGVRDGIEKVTTETQAMELVEQFIKDRMSLTIDNDLKTVANLKIAEKT